MDIKHLLSLIKKEENTKLDFKIHIDIETESGRKELAKDVCAIANSRGGRGYLVIGVEDKSKKLVGIEKATYSEETIQQIISSRTEPPVPVSYEEISINFPHVPSPITLGVLTIYDSPQRPFQIRDTGAFYIRRGSTTDTMRKQELISALQDGLMLNVETCPVINSSINNLDDAIVEEYFSNMGIKVTEENKLELMINAAIVMKDNESSECKATLGGLLVFCKNNNIFLPHNMIRILNNIDVATEVKIIQGDLLSMLDKCNEYLVSVLTDNYPTNALMEAVRNAVLYRDYSLHGSEIIISIQKNSITVSSPGMLLNSQSSININSKGYIKRNMWVYERLLTLDNKKRLQSTGFGFKKMKNAFKNKRVIFINSIMDNSFKVIFPGPNTM